MGFRLNTSKRTKEIFEELGNSTHLKPFTLCKIAIALSLNETINIDDYPLTDKFGLELQRQTVSGDMDDLYKCLIENNLGRHLADDEYFPTYTKLHIDRGAEILYTKYKYSGSSLEKFITMLLTKENQQI